jgi:cardiolipin synthase A/B
MPRRPRRWDGLLLLAASLTPAAGCTLFRDQRHTYRLNQPLPVTDVAFRRSLGTFGTAMTEGNRVDLLNNGDEFYPAMLQAIAEARMSINLESYIYKADRTGERFGRALSDAARRGVEVRLLVDGKSALPPYFLDRLRRAGVHARIYHPIRPWTITKVTRRTHRKILVVDGAVCFTGGAGIADEWLGNARNSHEWREVQVRAAGPVAAQMQAIFSEDWTYTTGEIVAGEKFYPPIPPAGDMQAQAIKVSRGDPSSMAKMLYYMAIQSAAHAIHIQNAYFLPDSQMRGMLIQAAGRGVDVRVMVPGRNSDVQLVRLASRFHYGTLLAAGVRIYEYNGTMLHSKTAVIDGVFSTVGSINFDALSMKQNAEDNLVVYDHGFAAQLEATFTKDLERCREVTYRGWSRRGFEQWFADVLSWFWEPLY